MERKQKDYSKGKIYIIRNTENDKVYIGSTCQTLAQRMTCHRNDRTHRQHLLLYQAINDIGLQKFYIELIEDFPCERNEQLCAREGHYIRQFKSNVDGYNMIIAGRTDKEYYEQNKDKIKKYYVQNKDKINEQKKEYREQNKDMIKEYREQNKDNINEQKKQKIKCECGCEVSKNNISKHKKTAKHQQLMLQSQQQ